MEIILLEKVTNLGNLGDKVNVRPGYGRNYLVPAGKAVTATKENIEKFEARRAELEKLAGNKLFGANERSEKILALGTINMSSKAADEGKLFGSVSAADIAGLITEKGIEVEKREVLMPEGPIRVVGEYKIDLQLHSDVTISVTVNVEAE